MSQPIAPRPMEGNNDQNMSPSPANLQKTRKISTACGACKQRKTRCSGGQPCEACAARNSSCNYDASSDQRRKIANQRNVQDLQEAHHDIDRLRQLAGGMVAIIQAGHTSSTNDLIQLIRNGIDLSQLTAYVRNEVRANHNVDQAYQNIDFHIDGPADLPSPSTMLARMDNAQTRQEVLENSDTNSYPTDPALMRQ